MDKELYQQWKEKEEKAKLNMKNKKNNEGILIEVAAQHPLVDGIYPNEEFEKRLLLGIKLYNEFKKENEIVKIYVPGSRHKYKGQADKVSLSSAGKNFLLKNNIPEEDLYADNMNEKFKGKEGVYNSADECFVAAEIFNYFNFKELHCICSSGQMHRKALNYINLSVIPYMHTISCDEMYHSYVYEAFYCIPDVIYGEVNSEEIKRRLEEQRESRLPE